jgi:hypothetical protein
MQPEIKPSGFKRKGASLGTAMNQWQTKGLSDCSNEISDRENYALATPTSDHGFLRD